MAKALAPFLPAPDSLVDPAGKVRLGVFEEPLHDIGLDRARLSVWGVPLPARLVRLRLKEWQHFALILPDLFVGVAVVDAKFLHTTWCHVVNRAAGIQFEHQRQAPRLDLRLAACLWDERTHLHADGYRVDIHNHLDQGAHRLRVRIRAAPDRPAVSADVTTHHDLSRNRPLVVSLPVGPNRAMYSHKVALPLSGTLRVGDQQYRADPETCFAILDIHKALYPHHTWWRWATWVGHSEEGAVIAGNLTQNVNTRDDQWNENGLWLDGALQRLGPARFDYDRRNVLAPWHVTSVDGAVDLEFTPQGERSENLNLGLVGTTFHQPYGTFQGTVRHSGKVYRLRDAFGICEDHDAKW